jgi:Mg-chelatase subunit ChlI
MSRVFPFTAIVGQDQMRCALILNAIHPEIGGVLIRGEPGTAKSTAARALAALLPEIDVVEGCLFGCDPDWPSTWCTDCRERSRGGHELARSRRRTGFVNLPVSSTEDRVVGTLDIEQAIQKGERRFEPGVLAAANRGILYVDEVNLLDDHVVDLLLDVTAMGVNIVEREGISFSHPARFILIGTMNPEEGELRPQLLDRFPLCVDLRGIHDPESRMAIMERTLAFEADPSGFYQAWQSQEQTLSSEIASARASLPSVRYTTSDLSAIATMMSRLGVNGHRPDIVVLKTARAHAAWGGREWVTDEDILRAAELTLPHRFKRHPFDDPDVDVRSLAESLAEARKHGEAAIQPLDDPDHVIESPGKKKGANPPLSMMAPTPT